MHLLLAFMIGVDCLFFAAAGQNPAPDIKLVGSTPGDPTVKSLLSIDPDTKIDFIRWQLTLSSRKEVKKTFILDLNFGESQPNTLGFINGGEKKTIRGYYSSAAYPGNKHGKLYTLMSNTGSPAIMLVQLSENVYHLLTSQHRLAAGNGGWSYTLNRVRPMEHAAYHGPVVTPTSAPNFSTDTSRQIIFEGRTPCMELAKEYGLTVTPGCFKLKWRLILNRDPVTLSPTTYILNRTNSRNNVLTGKWTIINSDPPGPGMLILQLDPDNPPKSISLLLGDENVAFFLHKDKSPFTGNADFSYTLNRKN